MRISTTGGIVCNDGVRRANDILKEFVGREITLFRQGEFQLRLMFGLGIEFVVSSAWRLLRDGCLVRGSGDGPKSGAVDLECLKGLKVVSSSVSESWDSKLALESNYVFEVIADSLGYETWEAHLEVGWAVFSGGEITLFPPAQRTESHKRPGNT